MGGDILSSGWVNLSGGSSRLAPKTKMLAEPSEYVENQGTEHSATRREVLVSAGAAVSVGLTGWTNSPETSDTIPSRKIKANEDTRKTMTDSLGFLTLPGLSFTSLAAHLPTIYDIPDQQTPIIVIDTFDYGRFRSRVLEERTQKLQYLGMVFEDLRRRGGLRLLDYADYYSNGRQQEVIQETRSALETANGWKTRNAAMEAAKGWVGYGRGEYQASFRGALGENLNEYENSRYKVGNQIDKMERGLGDPIGWVDNVMKQYRAALEVRRQADSSLEIDIPCIIGQGESSVLSSYIGSTANRNPDSRFVEINPQQTAQNRKLLEEIATEGRKIAGVQHEDWFVLGPRLTFPQYSDIFDFELDRIAEEIWDEVGTRTVIEEAKEIRTILDERNEQPTPEIRAEADYIVEKYDIQQNGEEIRRKLEQAVRLGHSSRDLRDLNNSGYSQAALFVAASMKRDPVRRYSEDEMYRQCIDTMSQLEPQRFTTAGLERFRDRGSFRRQEDTPNDYGDWYQSIDRWR